MSQRKKGSAGLSPEQRSAKDLKARRKFKAVARLVMANLFWLGDLEGAMGENVMLNIQRLTRKKLKKSTLTTQEKLILIKPKEDRTEEDKHLLNRAIGGLKCFRRYPSDVKSQLAAVTYFVYIGPDRVIVRQDHAPSAMYFLLSGEGVVTVRTYDKMLKEWMEEEHGTIGAGTMFGEVALIHGIARTATITTTLPCELLMIKKEDFDIVLKDTVWKAWEQIAKIMHRFSYFQNWDTVTKRECSIISRTKSFAADEVVFGDDVGLSGYSYLITKGTCSVIEHLQVASYYINGFKKYKLTFCDEYAGVCKLVRKKKTVKLLSRIAKKVKTHIKPRVPSYSKEGIEYFIEDHFIKICEFTEGAIFNVGEHFERRCVVADTTTNCLLIPRYWLLKVNSDNLWSKIQQFLNTNIPPTATVFKEWLKEKKCVAYGRKLVNDILSQKKIPNTNNIHNVPYSIRLKESAYLEV